MFLQKNFENSGANVLNFNQIFTVIPLNMDYLIKEFSFLKVLGKNLGGQ